MEDAPDVQRLAGAEELAKTTLSIPHPYEDGMAEDWIAVQAERYEAQKEVHFAITLKDGGTLIGDIRLVRITPGHHAELGFWVGLPYWGHGYCTEAGRVVLRYAFETLGLRRVHGAHLSNNPASGRVLEKLGMKLEGVMRQHAQKWDKHYDIHLYGILRDEYVK
jgi:RimJ/RimL family protein N-acetyltransferase